MGGGGAKNVVTFETCGSRSFFFGLLNTDLKKSPFYHFTFIIFIKTVISQKLAQAEQGKGPNWDLKKFVNYYLTNNVGLSRERTRFFNKAYALIIHSHSHSSNHHHCLLLFFLSAPKSFSLLRDARENGTFKISSKKKTKKKNCKTIFLPINLFKKLKLKNGF